MSRIWQYMKEKQRKKRFNADCTQYTKLNNDDNFRINSNELLPVYEEDEPAGRLDEHYFLQDIWMARQVRLRNEKKHYDVGSRVDGFISHLLSMDIEVTLIDIRNLDIRMDNLKFVQSDATNLSFFTEESISSLSSLHAIEHFGLGRYGDKIDPEAWKKALYSFERVLKRGGYLYISVPIGEKSHIVFNAHRVFAPQSIISELSSMKLVDFAFIENYNIYEIEDFKTIEEHMSGKEYLCGCFVFQKQ